MSICELSLEVLQMANFSQITHSPTFGRASNQPVEKHRVRVRPWAPSLRWNEDIQTFLEGPRWQSGNTLASHLCGRGSIPVMAVSGKAGSCLPLVGSLQYRTLANYMYWFPLPFQLPVVI